MDEGTGPTIVIWRREESNWDNYKEENIPFFPFFCPRSQNCFVSSRVTRPANYIACPTITGSFITFLKMKFLLLITAIITPTLAAAVCGIQDVTCHGTCS